MRRAVIPPICELRDVFPKVLLRHRDVRSSDRTLEMTPMAFDGVGVVNAAHVFAFRVRNRVMLHAEQV